MDMYRLVFPDTSTKVRVADGLGSGLRKLYYVEIAGENDCVCFHDEFPTELDFLTVTTVRKRETVVLAMDPAALEFAER